MSDAWSRIERWCRDHLPDALEHLSPPATDEDIAAAEAAMGLEFPDDLKALYRIANGSMADLPSVFDDGHWFMPLNRAEEHFATMLQFADEKTIDDYVGWRALISDDIISVKGPVKPWIFSKRWIPFSTSNGDIHRYIDLDPAPGGSAGQVIQHYPEACSHEVLADGLAEFLESYATRLEAGRYRIDDGWLVDTEAPADADWGLPTYLQDESAAAPTADEEAVGDADIELVGEMGMLAGTGDETFFSMTLDNGEEHDFLATRKETRGYSNIRIEQRARVEVVPAGKGHASFLGRPEFLVLCYRVVK